MSNLQPLFREHLLDRLAERQIPVEYWLRVYEKVWGFVQVGPNRSMLRLADKAERWLDKPVVVINAATFLLRPARERVLRSHARLRPAPA